MKTSWLKATLTLAFALGFCRSASAVTTTDSLTVTIRPNAYYAVDITTNGLANLDLGTVDLSAVTQTIRPATVTVQSTFATTDLTLTGAISASQNAWSFDADSSTVETDSLAAWAVFTNTAESSAPAQTAGYFNGTTAGASNDLIDGSAQQVGDGSTGVFEVGSYDTDSMAPSAQKHLWFYFRMPSASTAGSSVAQNITITIGAEATN